MCRNDEIGNPTRSPTDPERVADSYAANLLLPRYLFVPRARGLGSTNLDNLKTLASEFSTSLRATAIRLVEFGPEPAILVCHNSEGRRWFNRPSSIPDRWFPRQELDADSCAFEVLHGEKSQSRRTLMGADAWFDRYDADRYELFEQSFKAGGGEVLSLLVFKDDAMLED